MPLHNINYNISCLAQTFLFAMEVPADLEGSTLCRRTIMNS